MDEAAKAFVQYGLAGICALLIILVWKMSAENRKTIDNCTTAITELSLVIGNLKGYIEGSRK